MLKILETSIPEKRESFKKFITTLLRKTGIAIHQEKTQTKPPTVDMVGRRFIGGDNTAVRLDFSKGPMPARLKDFSSHIEAMKLSQGIYIPFHEKPGGPLVIPPNVYVIDGERLKQLAERFFIKIPPREAEDRVRSLRRISGKIRKPELTCHKGRLHWLISSVKSRRIMQTYLVDVETGKLTVKKPSPHEA